MNERQKAFAYRLLDERLSTFLINGQHEEAIELLCDAALADIIDVYFYMSLLDVFRSVCSSVKSKDAEQDSNISPCCKECKKMEIHSMANRNYQVAELLNSMRLSRRARNIINQTDINIMFECFGGLNTSADVERFIAEYYSDDV